MSFLYALLSLINDIRAVGKHQVPRRIGRRVYGRITGRLAGRLFR